MLSRERRMFFAGWLRSPWYYGCPVPSSKRLGRAMAAQLSALSPDEYVVELGPGSGVVTRAIIQAGVDPKRLLIIERDHAFIEQLKKEFPQATVLQADATGLKHLVESHGIKKVAAVVSSLPLLSIPEQVRDDIVDAVFKVLKPDGVMVQYTYGLLSPVPKVRQQAIGIRGKITKRVWRNFPPARVWRYTNEA